MADGPKRVLFLAVATSLALLAAIAFLQAKVFGI